MRRPGAPDPSRAAGHASEAWEIEEPSSDAGGTILMPAGFQLQSVPLTKTSSVYIAIAGDTKPKSKILDMQYFGTHGYVPVWDSINKAVFALQQHLYGTTTPTEHNYTVYSFEIEEGKFYMRPDKFDRAMQKLFFPLPLDKTVTEASMQDVWKMKYMDATRWPHKYDWVCTFMDSISVSQVTCGTLKLDIRSGQHLDSFFPGDQGMHTR